MTIMKKILVLMSLLAVLLSLFACKNKDGNNDISGNNNQSNGSFGKGTFIQVVFNGEMDTQVKTDLFSALVYGLEFDPRFVDDATSPSEKELVIGKTNRPISETAYQKLGRVQKESDTDVACLIYVDDNSIAIAYEEDEYGIDGAFLSCINYFIDTMTGDIKNGTLSNGVVYKKSFDPIEYQRAIDKENRDYEWAYLETSAGKEVAEATKNYYSMYSERLISWIADLYDPDTGAFYYSNSGRNTEGYLPDIESTFNVLSMIENSGMVDHLGGKYSDLPDWFLEKMGRWVKSLQDTNGYFYHPQWGKELTDTKPNRRSRDLNYGSGIMAAAGLSPTYNTPIGGVGDFTLNDGTKVDNNGSPIAKSPLTTKLGSSIATAVSKVVPVADTYVSDYLKNEASFKAYLYSLDLKGDSYSVGNLLSNQVSEIKQRDKALGGTLVPILEKWLIEFQNPETGTWDWTGESDPSYRPYDGVNGVLKLLTLFNNLGIEYPNPIPAARSIIKAIYADETQVSSVCDVYNTWYALEDLFDNLKAHSKNSTETAKVISDIRDELRADAPELITLTSQKVSLFIKPDSSSSFLRAESSATSQGMRVAVPHTNEGDTNATTINTFGTLNHMFNVLGWKKPKMFGEADYYEFMSIIEEQDSIIKDPVPPITPNTFDDDTVDQTPGSVSLEKCTSDGRKVVIEDPTNSKKGNVFMFESTNTGHDSLYLLSESRGLTASCYIFESDIYISTESSGYFSRIYLESSYAIGLVIKNGVIHFIDTTTISSDRFEQDLGFTANLNEWFNLRIEYYSGDVDTVRMKIYLNGECVAVSDSFYDEGYGVPRPFYEKAKIEVFSTSSWVCYLDNLIVNKSEKIYKEETNPDLTVNVDQLDKSELVYDFEDVDANNLPEGWVKNDSTTTNIVSNGVNNSLNVKGGKLSLTIPMHKITKDANAIAFDGEITYNSFADDSIIELLWHDSGVMGTNILRLRFYPTIVDGETVMMLYEASGGVKGTPIRGTELRAGQKYYLTIEYYEDKDAALVYVDGTLVGFTSADEAYANRGSTARVSISNIGTGNVDFTLDNVKVEKRASSFDYAVKPEKDSITHDFEQGIPEGGTIVGATVTGGSNKAVDFAGGGTLKIPVNKRSVATDAIIFSASLLIPRGAVSGDQFDISFVTDEGKIIIKYCIIVKGDVAEIYEATSSKVYTNSLATISLGITTPIVIEYYKSREVAHIFINDVCEAVTSVTYSNGNGNLDADYVVLESLNSNTNITVDNLIIESYNKFFVYRAVSGVNTESNSDTVTFETSTTGNIPQRFSTDLRTASAAIRIKEMMNESKASKVLSFETSAGANDRVFFYSNKPNETNNTIVFTSDLCFDLAISSQYEVYLTDKYSNHSYMMLFTVTKDGSIKIADLSYASSSLSGRIFGKTIETGVKEGEWFNLRMEYYKGDHDTVRIKTYINNELVYVSCNYYGRSTTIYGTQPKGGVNTVIFSSYSAAVGTLHMDNMSIVNKVLPWTDAPLTHTPTNPEPDIPNDEDGAHVLTFESSESANLPSALTKELKSAGATLTVEEVIRAGKKTKAISVNTTSGNAEIIYLAKTKTQSGYNAIVFQTDIYFTNMETNGELYLSFRNGNTVLTRITLWAGKDGNISFNDRHNNISSLNLEDRVTNKPSSEWHTLKLTLYSYNGSCRLKIELDDFTVTSTNSSWSSITPSQITSVRIDTYSGMVGSTLYDNMSLSEETINIPKEHEHTYSTEWIYDDINHWNEATCSDNATCADAKLNLSAHEYGENDKCVCGFEKPKQPESTTLGYFDTYGGYDFTNITGVWADLEKKNIIKRTSDMLTANQVDHTNTSNAGYLNLRTLGDNKVLAIGITPKGYLNQGATPGFNCYIPEGTGDCYVFESDVYIGPNNNITDLYSALSVSFCDSTGDAYTTSKIATSVVKEDGTKLYDLFGSEYEGSDWFNLCVKYYASSGIVECYIDGKLISTSTVEATTTSMARVKIEISRYADQYMYFDNMFFGAVDEVYE